MLNIDDQVWVICKSDNSFCVDGLYIFSHDLTLAPRYSAYEQLNVILAEDEHWELIVPNETE